MSWLTDREIRNAPHIGRGTVLALIFWAAGAYLFSLHWAMMAAFVGTFLFSLGWEFRDLYRFGKTPAASDGFDPWDIAADMIGAGLFGLSVLVYQLLEKTLYNRGGIF